MPCLRPLAAIVVLLLAAGALLAGCGPNATQDVAVPDVVGLDGGRAQARLAAAGLVSVASVSGPAGGARVRAQTPTGGALVPVGSVVEIRLAAPPG